MRNTWTTLPSTGPAAVPEPPKALAMAMSGKNGTKWDKKSQKTLCKIDITIILAMS
jgi:hypothetical protein